MFENGMLRVYEGKSQVMRFIRNDDASGISFCLNRELLRVIKYLGYLGSQIIEEAWKLR